MASPQFMTIVKVQRSLRHYCHILVLYLGVNSSTESCQPEWDVLVDSPGYQQHPSTSRTDPNPQNGMRDEFGFLSGSKSDAEWSPPQRKPPNSESPSSSSAPSRRQCVKCLKTFSTTSILNKHKKSDCKLGKMIRYACRNRGCKQQFTRESYRAVHEKEKCPVTR